MSTARTLYTIFGSMRLILLDGLRSQVRLNGRAMRICSCSNLNILNSNFFGLKEVRRIVNASIGRSKRDAYLRDTRKKYSR